MQHHLSGTVSLAELGHQIHSPLSASSVKSDVWGGRVGGLCMHMRAIHCWNVCWADSVSFPTQTTVLQYVV